LRVFDVDAAAFFFGREALVQWLLNDVRPATEAQPVNRFLAIVGASGSGKSSVARAGLVAAIKHDAIPGSSRWPVAILRPGPDPVESLPVALSRAVNVGQGAPALAELIVEFLKNEKAVHLIARQSLSENASGMRLMILVDQFEEVFTLCPKEDLREAFIRNLLYAAKVTLGQTLVILTMRADFYPKCAANAALAAAFSDHHVLVGPMSEDELRRAIERPMQLVGGELEGGLVDLLLRDVHQQSGALPLLQHALLELWNKRDGRRLSVKAYQEIGKLEGALQRRADATLKAFSQDEQELCRRTFLRLTQPGEGTEDTKRRASMQELLSLSGESVAQESIIQRVANASLLTTEGDLSEKDSFVEVAHEALIRSWPQLRKWIDADRAGLRTRTRLTEATRDWKNAGCDPAYLYGGARLAVAEEWAASHPRELSADETEFLRCSREAQQQREASELEAARNLADALRERAEQAEKAQRLEAERADETEKRSKEQKESANKLRRRAFVATGAAVIALILLAVSVLMWRAAQEQAKIADQQKKAAQEQANRAETATQAAQHALTDGFFRTIGVSHEKIISQDEREALWKLAQLDRANAAVHRNLLNRWFGTEEAFMRGAVRGGQGFRAATGLNVEYHRLATSNAAELGRSLATALENPRETAHDRLSGLGNALVALANEMAPQAAPEIAKGLATALENPQETAPDRLSNLHNALVALADKMEPQAAAEIAKGLAAALENPQETVHDWLSRLGNAPEAPANKK
jgi:hypothetical protein